MLSASRESLEYGVMVFMIVPFLSSMIMLDAV